MSEGAWASLAVGAVASGCYNALRGSKEDAVADFLTVALLAAGDYVFHNPFCGVAFQCGCGFGWTFAQGWKNCNVHQHVGPRCPWCICSEYLGGWACLFVKDLLVVAIALAAAAAVGGRPRLLVDAGSAALGAAAWLRARCRSGRGHRPWQDEGSPGAQAGGAAEAETVIGVQAEAPGAGIALRCPRRRFMPPTAPAHGCAAEGGGAAAIMGGVMPPAFKAAHFATRVLLPGVAAWLGYNFLCGAAFFAGTDYPWFFFIDRGTGAPAGARRLL